MSSLTAENILKLIEQLPAPERSKLQTLLNQQSEQPPAKAPPAKAPLDKRLPCEPMKDRTRELEWIAKHRHEYAGQWVALDGDRLIAASPVRAEISAAVKADGAPLPLIDRIPAPDEPLFMGL